MYVYMYHIHPDQIHTRSCRMRGGHKSKLIRAAQRSVAIQRGGQVLTTAIMISISISSSVRSSMTISNMIIIIIIIISSSGSELSSSTGINDTGEFQ